MRDVMIDTTLKTRRPEHPTDKTCSLLVFRADEQPFALDIEYVTQIIAMLRLMPVPQVDYMIEGIANIHGDAVPVINTRRYLGMADLKPGMYTPIILAKVMGRQIGLIVDEVIDVISVQIETIVAPGDMLLEDVIPPPILSGLVYQQGHSVFILDPRYFLRSSQFSMISRSINANAHLVVTHNPQKASNRSGLHQPIPSDRVTFELIRAALARKLNSGNQNPNSNSSPAKDDGHSQTA